jgi:hypothetical protein
LPCRLARACSCIGSRPTHFHSFRRLARLTRVAAFRLLELTRDYALQSSSGSRSAARWAFPKRSTWLRLRLASRSAARPCRLPACC